MNRNKLFWQLFPVHVFILFGVTVSFLWYGGLALKRFYQDHTTAGLEAQARLLESRVRGLVEAGRIGELQESCRQAGRLVSSRITVVDRYGTVLCDTSQDPAKMENHADRPEIQEALAGATGVSVRFSTTTGRDMLYVAVPVISAGRAVAVLRTALPLTAMERTLTAVFWRTAAGIGFIAVLAALATLLVSRRLSRPLEIMKQGALRFAAGDFGSRVSVSGPEEIAGLAQTLNRMAAQLDERIRAAVSQRNEIETMVASMLEGVLAVDTGEKILYSNRAAREQLGIETDDPQGVAVVEAVRHVDLLRLIQQTIVSDRPVEGAVVFNQGRDEERILQVHGAQLVDAARQRIGALIVTNDVTRLLRLENLRRDFVANVSHELKTPITSIKGYVETLLDEVKGPPHVHEFLEIVMKHANRLQAIVEDLLTLSRLEQDKERQAIALAPGAVEEVLRSVVELSRPRAAAKNIKLVLRCAPGLEAEMNGPLLEQAILNLVENGIRYSEPGGSVTVAADSDGTRILIQVSDTGPGIAAHHLPRLFERFYIVDKARTRKLGGTGLGLAIVKHIVQAHHGRVRVESEPGRGSTFTVSLPLRAPRQAS